MHCSSAPLPFWLSSPRADNSKASGRERNRRVSIRITY